MTCDWIPPAELASKLILAGAVFWLGRLQYKLKEKERNDVLFDKRLECVNELEKKIMEIPLLEDGHLLSVLGDTSSAARKTEAFRVWTSSIETSLINFKMIFGPELYYQIFKGVDQWKEKWEKWDKDAKQESTYTLRVAATKGVELGKALNYREAQIKICEFMSLES